MSMTGGYVEFFNLEERPFSLTSDPRFFFRSRSHGRALESLTFGLRNCERQLVVTGDLGVGKTTFCRTLVDQLRKHVPVSFVPNPLLTPGAFARLLEEDLGVTGLEELAARQREAVVIIDEAHLMPAPLVHQILALAARQDSRFPCLRCVFVGQTCGNLVRIGIPELDELVTSRIRLLPLGREECASYVDHRLSVAGAMHRVRFAPRALDYIFALSGGVPRLVNLLCERALQEAAMTGSEAIEPATVDLAAATLQLLRSRSRKFRWYTKRVS